MKLSVVIPVYNEEAMIIGCLDSLRQQTRQPDEVIIVDNNCTDRTVAIAQRYDVRIISETRQGIWPARAAGNNAASGDIIVGTDIDARFPHDWLACIEKTFTDTNAIAITGPGKFYDSRKIWNWIAGLVYMKPYFLSVGSALGSHPVFGSNFAMKATAWKRVKDEVHLTAPLIHDDIDLSYHLVKYGRIQYEPSLYNFISIRPFKHPRDMLRRYKKGMRSMRIHWPEQSPKNIYAARFKKKKS